MNTSELANKLVAVLGLGNEGMAVTRYLLRHGISPVLFDKRPFNAFSENIKKFLTDNKLRFIFGEDYLTEFRGFDLVFRSPGFYRLDPVLLEEEKRGLKVTSQTKLFFEICPAKIIGVTGTKGKGTTASLIHNCYKQGYGDGKVYLTGNIGKVSPLDIVGDLNPNDIVVYELSSFQLQDLAQSPNLSVTLMVTEEHLDTHKSVAEYHASKEAIAKFQKETDFSIVNADFPVSLKIGSLGKGKKLFFSRKKKIDTGLYLKGGSVVTSGLSDWFGLRDDMEVVKISDLQLRGEHNIENVCAAVLCAIAGGIDLKYITKTLSEFKGLEHRLEFVKEEKGVKFFNDSFATTPESSIAAIKAFTEPEIIILGGSEKNSDFSQLCKVLSEHKNLKAIILIGLTSSRIEVALKQFQVKAPVLVGAKNMNEIFNQIKKIAAPGDVVLLSPACASFDMFANYEDRGNQFKEAVLNFK